MGCFVGCVLDAATIIVDQSPKESDVPPRQGGFGGSGAVQSSDPPTAAAVRSPPLTAYSTPLTVSIA